MLEVADRPSTSNINTNTMAGFDRIPSSSRVPLQSRDINTIASAASNTKNKLGVVEVIKGEQRDSSTYVNTGQGQAKSTIMSRQISSGSAATRSTAAASSMSSSSASSSHAALRRTNSAPSMDTGDVIIEEKRRKGDGFTLHRYLRGRMLGKGGFAKVYMCTALDTNKNYAVKVVPKANLVKARAKQKVRCFQSVQNKPTIRSCVRTLH